MQRRMSQDMPEQREQGPHGTDENRQDVAGFGPSWRRSDDQHTLSFSEIDRVTGQEGGKDTQEEVQTPQKNWLKSFTGSLNFYRIHLMAFTFIPLIMSGIFHACNTEYTIKYIDALFVCVSSMTVTGLATINLSELSGFQQSLIFIQMLIGSPVFVSLLMITVRKYFFRQEFDHIIEARRKAKRERELESGGLRSPLRKLRSMSQSFSGPGRPAMPQDSWIERFKSKMGRDQAPRGRMSPVKEGEIAQSEDSSHLESAREKWKKEDIHTGVLEANPTVATGPNSGRDTPVDNPGLPRPAMERQSTNWAWNWTKHDEKPPQKRRIQADMIKRVEGGGLGLINPMGWYQSSSAPGSTAAFASFAPTNMETGPGILDNPLANEKPEPLTESPRSLNSQLPLEPVRSRSPESIALRRGSEPQLHPVAHTAPPVEDKFPRTKTIAFDGIDEPPRTAYASARESGPAHLNISGHHQLPRTGTVRSAATSALASGPIQPGGFLIERTVTGRRSINTGVGSKNLPYSQTYGTGNMPRTMTINQAAKHENFGGFPTPLAIGKALFLKVFPDTGDKLKRNLTMHRTITQAGTTTHTADGISEIRPVEYISFDAIVGRNSHFHDLTKEEHDELGGVEYRSLRVLFWIVLAYYIALPLTGFVIFGPYIRSQFEYVLSSDSQYRYVPPLWFSAFQAVSAFSNTGMSLVDLSMIPFQKAYPMIFVIVILIFAGNTAFPIFLRFTIWILSIIVPKTSRVYETLRFLLDHPRRCFVYLFPSTQTWFLFLVMITLTTTDFVSFMVLDIGTPDIEALPVGIRIVAGILQSTAVRAAGFAIVPLNSLAPAVKVLYVVMQYISVYPIAMSIRSTNVYEEKSLGVWKEEEEGEEPQYQGHQAVAKYLGWHARRQLAFDIWWLAFALWLICVIERGQLNDRDNATWFNIFNVIFELVSAYGTVGLSLGVGYDNFSLCGSFSVLAKLVIIAVMIRGRHRGLPVAIDRAIMLPKEFTQTENVFQDEDDRLERRTTRRGSMNSNPATGISMLSGTRRESNLSGPPASHHQRTASGDASALAEPSSPKVGRRISMKSNLSQPEVPLDRSPERARAFSLGRINFDAPLLPRSLSTVQESGLSRAPTRRDTNE